MSVLPSCRQTLPSYWDVAVPRARVTRATSRTGERRPHPEVRPALNRPRMRNGIRGLATVVEVESIRTLVEWLVIEESSVDVVVNVVSRR